MGKVDQGEVKQDFLSLSPVMPAEKLAKHDFNFLHSRLNLCLTLAFGQKGVESSMQIQ